MLFDAMVEGKDWTCRLAAESLVPEDVDLYGPDKPGESHHMYIPVSVLLWMRCYRLSYHVYLSSNAASFMYRNVLLRM